MDNNFLFEQYHTDLKNNRWMRYFTTFVRVALAFGFFGAGMIKILGERFTSLSVNHPMGHYLEALHLTGYYYTFIGIAQVTAAVLLIIPRTATLGALLYLPIILNICILSLAVKFEGSRVTSPLMVLANTYLLFWDYDKLKYILPFNSLPKPAKPQQLDNKFPVRFFLAGFACVVALIVTLLFSNDIMPRNTMSDCRLQCEDSDDPTACFDFCNDIHQKGEPIGKALDDYHKAVKQNASGKVEFK